MNNNVRIFIENNIGLIDEHQYDELYSKLLSDMMIEITGELSAVLLSAGIDCMRYLTKIPPYFLGRVSKIKSVTIPNNITAIGDFAFTSCYDLESIKIGSGVQTIENSAFWNCKKLKNVTIPNNVLKLGSSVFKSCTNLENVILGEELKWIQRSTFANCKELKTIVLPDAIELIDEYAFFNCSNLQQIVIGNHIRRIGDSAFDDCSSLKEIIYRGSREDWNKISVDGYNVPLHDANIIYLR